MSIYSNDTEKNDLYNFFSTANYYINNINLNNSVSLIKKLWEIRNIGGVLPETIIKLLIKCDILFENANERNVSHASYDLSLGDEYYYSGKINQLSEKEPFIIIEPYDYVIASCDERINMPRDISGRFDLTVNLFCQGIILSNSTQVDPGFRGKLFCLLFNTSNKAVCLKRKMHYATMELNKLIEPTNPYNGKYSNEDSIVSYLPTNIMQGAINELKKEIESLKNESIKMQTMYLGVLSLFVAIIALVIVLN